MTIKDITAIARVEASYGYQYFESYFVMTFAVYFDLWFDSVGLLPTGKRL